MKKSTLKSWKARALKQVIQKIIQYGNYTVREEKCQMEHIPGYDRWKTTLPDGEESQIRTKEPGYEEVVTGIFVSEEDAYDYAMERISQDEDLKQEFVEWFYSNWIKEE